MQRRSTNRRNSIENLKYTSGEKCLCIHVVVTFLLILLLLFVYIVHLFVVRHSPFETIKTRRKANDKLTPNFYQVGYVLIHPYETKVICNTILITRQWSLAPAHCVIIRTDPDIRYLLHNWLIRYIGSDKQGLVTGIKSSIAHPQFNKNNFAHNIGLLEHNTSVELNHNEIIFDINVIELPKYNYLDANEMKMVGWRLPGNYLQIVEVVGQTRQNCTEYKNLVTSNIFRDYEYCVSRHSRDFEKECVEEGASLFRNGQIIGFFSWGEKCDKAGTPFVFIDLSMYLNWIKDRLIMME